MGYLLQLGEKNPQLTHPGGPSSRCPAWNIHTHFSCDFLMNITYSNPAPGILMFLVKRRASDWMILLSSTPPDEAQTHV